MNEILTVTMR